jgi:hypothetical protein
MAAGLAAVLEATAMAPSFLFQTELGASGTARGAVPLTAHERASVLSFFLSGGPPDEALWQAAETGALAHGDGVAAVVDRMLDDKQVRVHVGSKVLAWLRASEVLDAVKDEKKLGPLASEAARRSALTSTSMFVDALLWQRRGTIEDLLTAPWSFVDGTLAKLYGVAPSKAPAAFVEMTLPADQRAGVLTHASVLATLASPSEASVVSRGLFVREHILCQPPVPEPPESIGDAVAEQEKLAATERGKAQQRADNPQCRGCHGTFDGLGLLLEHYDAIGRYRTSIGGAPVDAAATVALAGTFEGRLSNVLELVRRPELPRTVASCFTTVLLRAALARPVEPDSCAVADLARAHAAEGLRLAHAVRLVAGGAVLSHRVR